MARSIRSARTPVTATYEATLVYYDEPQLIVLNLQNKRKIIATAIERGDMEYPFFGAEISEGQWNSYLREINDLRYLFEYPKFKKWYVFDFAKLSDADTLRIRPADWVEVPEVYMPAGQFFARSHTEAYGLEQNTLGVEQFLIDGAWDFSDFSAFYGKISDLYAFFLSFNRYYAEDTEPAVRGNIRSAYQRYPLKGGASYRFFYRDLFNTQSIMDRLNVDSIQYASPGHVDVHARHDIFADIKDSLAIYKRNVTNITSSYNSLRKYLSKARLLTANAEDFDSNNSFAAPIYKRTDILCSHLAFDRLDQVFELTGRNSLATAKIILSYTRRLDRSFRFFAEGRVAFGNREDRGKLLDIFGGDASLPPELDIDPLEDGSI